MKYSYSKQDLEIIKAARKNNRDKQVERRLKAIELRIAGKKAKEIAEITEFHPAYIVQLMAKYRNGGIEAITGNHYGGNRRNMSIAEEAKLLEPFRQRASQGQMIEVSEIKAAYEKAVGHRIGGSQMRTLHPTFGCAFCHSTCVRHGADVVIACKTGRNVYHSI